MASCELRNSAVVSPQEEILSFHEEVDGEEEDSIVAVASEDDDEEYSVFVDESGRSRCGDSVCGGGENSTNNQRTKYVANFGETKDVKQRIPVGNQEKRPAYNVMSKPAFSAKRQTSVPEKELRMMQRPGVVERGTSVPLSSQLLQRNQPAQQSQQNCQLWPGPGGLVLNMDEPWERSLQRQMNGEFLSGSFAIATPAERFKVGEQQEGATARNYKGGKKEALLLGHTESRDFAIEVSQDDISLGTSASSTVPSRMQIIHRSYLNNYMAHKYQIERQQQRRSSMMMNQNPHTRHPTSYQYYQYDINNNHRGPNQAEHLIHTNSIAGIGNKVKIGDFVKGCRSADESTVSYLTNQFGNAPLDDRDEKQYESAPGFQTSVHKQTEGTLKQCDIESDPLNFLRYLEMETSNPDLTKVATSSAHEPSGSKSITGHGNMAPDPACFCMGYNVLDYFLPPPESSSSIHHPVSGRIRPISSSRHYSTIRTSSQRRLPRVEEGEIDPSSNPTYLKSSINDTHHMTHANVIDLTTATGANMNYLPLQQLHQYHPYHNSQRQYYRDDAIYSSINRNN